MSSAVRLPNAPPTALQDDPARCEVNLVHPEVVARVEARMPAPERVDDMTGIYKALSDPTRFRILSALAEEELCVCDLAVIAGANESTTSHQLRLLRALRLVTFRKAGRMAYYRIIDERVRPLLARPTRSPGD